MSSLTRIEKSRRIMNLLDFRARFQMNPRREMLGFAHREVARNHEKSVKKVLLSLDKKSRKSPI